jgi:hypothetical protein
LFNEEHEIGDLVKDLIFNMEHKYQHPEDQESGYATGKEDDFLRYHPGTVNVVAGDCYYNMISPSIFTLNVLNRICIENKTPTGIICFETNRNEITNKLTSIISGVSQERIRKLLLRKSDFDDLANNLSDLYDSPLYIYEPPIFSITEVIDCIKSLVDRDVKVLYIESLQWLNPESNVNGTLDFSKTMRKLKEIAYYSDIVLILGFTFPNLKNYWMEKKRRDLRRVNYFYPYPGIVQTADSITVLTDEKTDSSKLHLRDVEINVVFNKRGPEGSLYHVFDFEKLELIDRAYTENGS